MHGARSCRRLLCLFGWACAAVPCLPALAWAQVSVQYQTLTLVESAYLYSGLALQSVLRLSSLRQLPQAIMACGVVWLLYRRVTGPHPQPLAGVVAYVVSCAVILVLFWPEAAPRFFCAADDTGVPRRRHVLRRRSATPWSWTTPGPPGWCPPACKRPAAPRCRASPTCCCASSPPCPLPWAKPSTRTAWRAPFHRIPALRELMQQEVPPGLTAMMPEFVNHCYNPACRPGRPDLRPRLREGGALGLGHVGATGKAGDADRPGPGPDPQEVAAGPVLGAPPPTARRSTTAWRPT